MEAYKRWVRRNKEYVHSLESLANGLTWLLPERFSESEIVPEAVTSILGIVTVVNEHIIETTPTPRSQMDTSPPEPSSFPYSLCLNLMKDIEKLLVEVVCTQFLGYDNNGILRLVIARLALLRDSGYKMLLHGGETINDGKDPNEANQQHTNGRLLHNGRNGHFTPEGRALSAMSRFGENARMLSDPTWFRRAEHHQRAIMELPVEKKKDVAGTLPHERSLLRKIHTAKTRKYGENIGTYPHCRISDRTCISITMNFINEVVNGGVTIILFVVTNPVCVPKKRNLSIFRGLKGAWKHIRTLEWKWKRDGTPVPSEMGQLTTESDFAIIFISVIVRKEGPAPSCSRIVSLSFSTLCLRISQFYFSMGAGKGYNSAVECHLDVVEVISSSLIIPKPNGWLYFWERTPGEYEAHGYKLGLGMKDNSESALSTNKEAITTLGLRHGPDSYGRQQWGIFRNGRKPDGAMPRGAAVIQRMQALSGMIGRKASVGGFLSPPSNPRAQLWTGGGNYQAGVRGANGIRYPSSPSRKRWILGAVRIDPCSAVANALSIPPGETLPGLDMPRILLKERGAFGNADTGGAWLSSARANCREKPRKVRMTSSLIPLFPRATHVLQLPDKGHLLIHMAVNPFSGLVHTARHTMGAGHARSRYLNRKEGDAEGRASDWSEVVTRSEQVDRIPLFTSPCPLCGDMEAKKGKRGMGFLSLLA
ncbi:peroxisome biogenesis protein 16-like protein isoform X1 [Tanacetum coccineum]|uniref:Peroxisome biogenesis protein 16-like protein isoform X1 n=1 Tax=Tanacetum coccineum TaxID=301880 RepID=A0ABQ4XQT5_9ASTR